MNKINDLNRRVAALQAGAPTRAVGCHRIVRQPGQSLEDAIDEYGRNNIGDVDIILCRTIVDVGSTYVNCQ